MGSAELLFDDYVTSFRAERYFYCICQCIDTFRETIGPYTFNFLRFLIGAAVLIPAIRLSDAKNPEKKPHDKKSRKTLWIGGCSCGLVLFIAANLQQLGLYYGTTAGKAGFLTACYIVLVPILSIFLRKKCSWNIWLGVAITLAGLYFLCMNGSFYLQFSDVLVLICALVFACLLYTSFQLGTYFFYRRSI